MANNNDFQAFRDGTLPPCVLELAFSFRKDPPLASAAKISAFLTAHGATEKEVSEAIRVLFAKNLIAFDEDATVSPDHELLALCNSVSDCREFCSLLLGNSGDASYCSICPVCKRLGGIYSNENEDIETALLTMMYSCAVVGETREIVLLGESGQLATLFPANQYVTVFEQRHVFPVAFLLAYALYLICDSRMCVNVDSTDSLIDSIISVLALRDIPLVGSVDVARLFTDEGVRAYTDRLCSNVRYREIDYSGAFAALDYCKCTVFNERRSVMLGEEVTFRLGKFLDDFEENASVPDDVPSEHSANEGTAPPKSVLTTQGDDSVAEISPSNSATDMEACADNAHPVSPSADVPQEVGVTPGLECKSEVEQPLVINPISDEGAETSSSTNLADVKTSIRSIDKPRYDNGTMIVPLSSTGEPTSDSIVGKDGLINPYVALGEDIKKPADVYGLTPFTLAVSLESAQFYTVEYAICNGEEGFLVYIYQRRCVIFVGRSDLDFYLVILTSFRRKLPKKLTMLAAPLFDYLTRMGEPMHLGIIPVYDAVRKSMNLSDGEVLRISDILLPDTENLASALRQYSMIWKKTGLNAKDMEEDVRISAVFSSSVYTYEITGTRYPHLFHDGKSYNLGWSHSKLRANFVKMSFHLDREKTSATERSKCYRQMLVRLGNGNAYILRGLHLASCDADDGFSVVVPLAAYSWAHNSLFLRLGEVAYTLLGKHVGVTESDKCVMDKKEISLPASVVAVPQNSNEGTTLKDDSDENEEEEDIAPVKDVRKKQSQAIPTPVSSDKKRKDVFDEFEN